MTLKERGRHFITKNGFCLFLFAAVLAFFLLAGRSGPVLFDDSGGYMQLRWGEGVMPVYPILLLLNQYIFGDGLYLWVVIVEQALLAAFSVVFFEEALRRRFSFHWAEGILLAVLALYPYTIEMPTAVMTQAVITEGIAYSLFYIFLTLLLLAVWEKSYLRFTSAVCMTVLLAAVRSQLQILFGVCGIVFLYLICCRSGKNAGWRRRIGCLFVGLVGCVTISLAGILLVSGIVRGYRAMLRTEQVYMFALQVQQPEEYQSFLQERKEQERVQSAKTGEGALEEGQVQTNTRTEEELVNKDFTTSQYLTLVFSRGMYEADPADAGLFQDEVLRGLYLALYEAVDAEQQRYVYAQEGLWMWKDIVGGIGKIGKICFRTPSEYYVEYAPEIIASENFSETRSSHLRTVGMTLIKAHFGRFLYHTLMLLPQAFISTVFFQFAPLYLICHLVTAFLYLSATVLMIWGYADARAKKEGAEMMALVLGTNVVMVFVISLVFFGQQRYLVYAFGPFYAAYYLLMRQLWIVRVRGFLREKLLSGRKNQDA